MSLLPTPAATRQKLTPGPCLRISFWRSLLAAWCVLPSLALVVLLPGVLLAQGVPPRPAVWWMVAVAELPTDNSTVVTMQVVSQLASAAKQDLDQKLGAVGGAGDDITAKLSGAPRQTATTTRGLAQAIAALFRTRLSALGYQNYLPDLTGDATAPLTVGELKAMFRFNLDQEVNFKGQTFAQAVIAGLDPNDWYAGYAPEITKIAGDMSGRPGEFIPEPLIMRVTDAARGALVNAPVVFSLPAGSPAQLAILDDGKHPLVSTLTLRTNQDGLAWVFLRLLPQAEGSHEIFVTASRPAGATSTLPVPGWVKRQDPVDNRVYITANRAGIERISTKCEALISINNKEINRLSPKERAIVRQFLLGELEDPDPRIVISGASILMMLGEEEGIKFWLKAYHEHDVKMGQDAQSALEGQAYAGNVALLPYLMDDVYHGSTADRSGGDLVIPSIRDQSSTFAVWTIESGKLLPAATRAWADSLHTLNQEWWTPNTPPETAGPAIIQLKAWWEHNKEAILAKQYDKATWLPPATLGMNTPAAATPAVIAPTPAPSKPPEPPPTDASPVLK